MKRRKVVSKSQYRFFKDALRRIEAGGESPVKDMGAAELRYALGGVDYDSLPERAGQAAPKPRPQPRPTMPVEPPQPQQWHPEVLPDGTLSLDVYRVLHPAEASAVADDGDMGHVLSMEAYLQRNPEKKRRDLPSEVGAEWFPQLFKRVV